MKEEGKTPPLLCIYGLHDYCNVQKDSFNRMTGFRLLQSCDFEILHVFYTVTPQYV